jgi:acyl-CoA synthetase (NDP forming)
LVIQNLAKQGFEGEIYPINNKAKERIMGYKAYVKF